MTCHAFVPIHGFLEQCIGIFFVMHATQMLFKVVQARPALVRTRTAFSEAEIHHLRPTLGFLIVNAFLMAGKVVDGTESFFARTVRFVTFERLSMACLVFPLIRWTFSDPRAGGVLTLDRLSRNRSAVTEILHEDIS